MSQLQEDTKPFLVPLLTGQNVYLHRRAQTFLSAWTAMTIMVAEHMDRTQIAIPQTDRDWLRKNKEPPKHWRIWIAAHNRQHYPLYSHRVLTFVKEKIEERPADPVTESNTQTTTICLGDHLVIFAMSSIIGYDLIRRWQLAAAIRSEIHQIWPVPESSVFWPPASRLNDAGLALLTEHFFDRATRLVSPSAG